MARSLPKGFGQLSGKHIQVDKANTVVIIAAVAVVVVVVFSLFAAKSIIGIISYQNSVISLRKEANSQLEANYDAVQQLLLSYNAFDSAPESIIGTTDKNSKVILDSLPSKYDFPALVTTTEGIIKGAGCSVMSIGGLDDETLAIKSSLYPTTVPIGLSFAAKCSYSSAQTLINDLYRSIRPFKLKTLNISAGSGNITVVAETDTVYQPSKELGITETTVDESGELAEQPTTGTPTQTGETN